MIHNLIGIAGLAGVGKDTLADHLSKTYGHKKYSLAQPIKELLNARFGWTMDMWDDRQWKEAGHPQCGFAWKGAASHFSPRSWAQWLGTEVGREIGGEGIWVKRMVSLWYSRKYEAMVIPDVRFDNEADTICGMGGVVLRVVRPSAAPTEGLHVSAKGVRDEFISATIVNDRSTDDFLADACSVLHSLKERS